jgi:hypothetical protein
MNNQKRYPILTSGVLRSPVIPSKEITTWRKHPRIYPAGGECAPCTVCTTVRESFK